MDDMHKDIADKLIEALRAGIGDDAMSALKKQTDQILYDIETDLDYRLKDELAPNLVAFVVEMAKRTVEAILQGNQSQMERYLGCERGHWTGRSDSPEYGRKRDISEWHPVIHGELFERGAVELRKRIVEAHRDLIVSQRILDLEDQVRSLVAQNNKQANEIERLRNERREFA